MTRYTYPYARTEVSPTLKRMSCVYGRANYRRAQFQTLSVVRRNMQVDIQYRRKAPAERGQTSWAPAQGNPAE